jgi:hypothetical protein
VGDNGPITSALKVLSDGLGTNLPMEASTTGVNFTGTTTVSGVAVANATQLATKQDTLVSGTNIKTINSTSLLGSGNVAVQPTLVSGTNIKTLNSVSLLGAGDIVLAATPSGVSGAIQFSNGSAFASDAANFFWDDTNNRLGVGTNVPIYGTQLQSDTSGPNTLIWSRAAGNLNTSGIIFSVADNTVSGNQYHKGGIFFKGDGAGSGRGSLILVSNTANDSSVASSSNVGIALLSSGNNSIGTLSDLGARLGIKGSGSTSATTSLLVQNSAGQMALQVTDDRNVSIGNRLNLNGTFDQIYAQSSAQIVVRGYHGLQVSRGTGVTSTMFEVYDEATTTGGLLVNVRNTPFANMFAVNYLGQASMGTASPNASAQFQINSTTRGFLPPVMTTTQKNAIASPASGLVVYDNTTNKLQCYNGSTWNDLF